MSLLRHLTVGLGSHRGQLGTPGQVCAEWARILPRRGEAEIHLRCGNLSHLQGDRLSTRETSSHPQH